MQEKFFRLVHLTATNLALNTVNKFARRFLGQFLMETKQGNRVAAVSIAQILSAKSQLFDKWNSCPYYEAIAQD